MTAQSAPDPTADLTEVAQGIFYSTKPFVAAGEPVVEMLRQSARAHPLKRARLCAHPNPEADQQDMLIVSHRSTYVAPHRHTAKSESLVVLQGCASALLFSEAGDLVEIIPMGPIGSGRTLFYRMPPMQYHSLIIESDDLVFVESTKGPFVPSETEDAPWAPAADDTEMGQAFLAAAVASCWSV